MFKAKRTAATDGDGGAPSTSSSTPFQPPTYTGARIQQSSSKAAAAAATTSPPLKLARTTSHREVYDADTRSVDGEFGVASSNKYEDRPELYPDPHAPLSTRRTRSRSSTGRRPQSSSSQQQRRLPTTGDSTSAQHETLAEEVAQYEEKDARQRAEEQEVLDDVRSGHSGVSVVERYESKASGEGKHVDAANIDLEKQALGGTESGTPSSTPKGDTSPSSASSSDNDDHDDGEEDKHLVTWDSPESLENPRNWSLHRRWAVIVIVSSYTFLSPLSSSMIAPALPLISTQFNVTSTIEQSLMLSVFVLAYAVGPMLLGPMSEMFGRRIVLQLSNLFFIAFTVACAVAQNRVQLSIFRFFAGFGGSAPLSIGGGTVSDLMRPDERGTAMALYGLGPLLGPAIGPMIGGWIVERTGNWRWIFGVASIAAGVTAGVGGIILPETYAPVILGRKAARLRKETGNEKLHTIFDRKGTTFIQRLEHNLVRPFVLISTQPIIMVLSLYMMITYGTMYLVLTTFESVFRTTYHESVGIASLNYLSLAIGFTVGGQVGGRMVDRFYKRLRARNDGKGIPEFKLPVMMITGWCLPAGLLIYGWSADYGVHWIVPNIGAAIFSVGMLTTFQCIQNYVVDSFGLIAASAIAAITFLRSLAGFALPLAGPTMYEKLGYGWGNTVLAFIAAAVGIPAPFLLYKYGPLLRAKSRYATQS